MRFSGIPKWFNATELGSGKIRLFLTCFWHFHCNLIDYSGNVSVLKGLMSFE